MTSSAFAMNGAYNRLIEEHTPAAQRSATRASSAFMVSRTASAVDMLQQTIWTPRRTPSPADHSSRSDLAGPTIAMQPISTATSTATTTTVMHFHSRQLQQPPPPLQPTPPLVRALSVGFLPSQSASHGAHSHDPMRLGSRVHSEPTYGSGSDTTHLTAQVEPVPSLLERILTMLKIIQQQSHMSTSVDPARSTSPAYSYSASPSSSPASSSSILPASPGSSSSPHSPSSPTHNPLPPLLDASKTALRAYLTFRDEELEGRYTSEYVSKYFPTLWLAVLLSIVIWCVFVLTDVYKQHVDKREAFWESVAMRFGVALVALVPVAATMEESVRQRVSDQLLKTALFLYLLLFVTCQLGFGVLQRELIDPTFSVFIILVASMSAATFRLPCFLALACNALMWIEFLILVVTCPDRLTQPGSDLGSPWEAITWIAIAIVLFSFHGYSVERSMRSTFLSAEKLSVQEARSQCVLATMLPASVISELRTAQGSFVHSNYANVTVLFSHVHNFDQHTSELGPIEVVKLLNDLFSRFDTLTDKLNVYKVETIGDVYLVSAGVPDVVEQHACVLALLAIAMLDVMRHSATSTPRHREDGLQLRLGLHSGPVIAGVVGMKYPRFRLMGDTVNTASRMSTTCEPSQIQLSRATFVQLSEQFVCRYGGLKDVKGKGFMETYILEHVLPAANSNVLPVSTEEALGKDDALHVAERLGCAAPQRRSVASSVPPTPTTSGPRHPLRHSQTTHNTPSSSSSSTPQPQPVPVFHARPEPGRLYSNAVVPPGTDWESDDVPTVLAMREAGRTVHMLRPNTPPRRQREEEKSKCDSEAVTDGEEKVDDSAVPPHPFTFSRLSPSSSSDDVKEAHDSHPDSLFVDTSRRQLLPPTVPPAGHSIYIASGANTGPLPEASSNHTRVISSNSPSSAPDMLIPHLNIHVDTAPSAAFSSHEHVSPSISPKYTPRPSDRYKISATLVSTNFLRSIPTTAELQHFNPLRLSFKGHPQLERAFQRQYALRALRLVRVGFLTFML